MRQLHLKHRAVLYTQQGLLLEVPEGQLGQLLLSHREVLCHQLNLFHLVPADPLHLCDPCPRVDLWHQSRLSDLVVPEGQLHPLHPFHQSNLADPLRLSARFRL